MSAARKPVASAANLYSRYTWDSATIAVRMLICRGKYQLGILELVRALTDGRVRDKGEPAPEWSLQIVFSKLAKQWGCSAQSLRDENRNAVKRGLWESREDGTGVNIRICFENWDRIAAEEMEKAERRGLELVGTEPDDEPVSDDPARPDAGTVRLKPVTIRAGAPSKPLKIETGVKSIGFRVDGPGEYKTETVIQGGHIDVSVILTPNGMKELRKPDALISASKASRPVPISLPGGPSLPGSGDLLADLIRVQTGLVVDGPGCRRIERALNGSIPLPFYLGELATAVESVKNPRAGLAIHLAEHQIKSKWRLSQQAGPPADDEGMPEDQKKLMRQLRGGR